MKEVIVIDYIQGEEILSIISKIRDQVTDEFPGFGFSGIYEELGHPYAGKIKAESIDINSMDGLINKSRMMYRVEITPLDE